MTRRDDALRAVELGAWAVGFIFHAPSPRSVRVETAAAIADAVGNAVEKVGVFVDATAEEILATARTVGLTIVQLHGGEDAPFADALRPHLGDVWKAVRVGTALPRSQLEPFRGRTILLDAYVKGLPGGTGTTFAWELARAAREYGRIVLAGGLTPENVADAIRCAAPHAVDVASGVEARAGVKDPEKLAAFFAAARSSP
jgi:phosphoribosylanthranilate isomerase